MIQENYPRLIDFSGFGRYMEQKGLVLYWGNRNVYIELLDSKVPDFDLKQNLIDNFDHYNETIKEDKEKLTLELIDELSEKQKAYYNFRRELTASEVAENLNYHRGCEYSLITNEIFDYFHDNYMISLYESRYDEMLKKYDMKECNLEGTIFYSLQDKPAFLLDHRNKIIPINKELFNNFIDDMFKVLRSDFESDDLDELRYPTYVEDVLFYPNDVKYVYVDDKFVQYDPEIHSSDMHKFKKLTGE